MLRRPFSVDLTAKEGLIGQVCRKRADYCRMQSRWPYIDKGSPGFFILHSIPFKK